MSTFLEFRVPVPITTLAARVKIEGELPTITSGSIVTPSWNAAGGGSLWGTGGSLATRTARFLVFIGQAGMDHATIEDELLSVVFTPDPSFAPLRNCFRVQGVIPAAVAAPQSLYLKYAPEFVPPSPYGVAIYNVTAEAVKPAFSLGKHTTSARFY